MPMPAVKRCLAMQFRDALDPVPADLGLLIVWRRIGEKLADRSRPVFMPLLGCLVEDLYRMRYLLGI